MKILINTSSTFKGGGVQLAKSFIEECRLIPEHTYYVVLGQKLSKIIDKETFPDNFSFYTIAYRPSTKVFSFTSHNKFLKEIEKEKQPDIVFTTSGPAYWRPIAHHVMGFNLGHFIYRDSPFFKVIPMHKRIKWFLKGLVIKHFYKQDADVYVVQTDDVNKRLRKLIGSEKVYTVSNTISSSFIYSKSFENKLPLKFENEFRLLSYAAWYPHKNLGIIKKVIDQMNEDQRHRIRFVLTLPPEIFKQMFPAKYWKQVINVGPVKIEEGPSLYKECDALFSPTLLECFSASYAEAMSTDKPILTSDMSFARTVCGEAALYFDPMDPHDINLKINQLYGSRELQNNLIEKGKLRMNYFGTPQKRAKEYLKICIDSYFGRKN